MTNAATAPDAIAKLWDIARMWLADAIHAFGAPAAIAELRRSARRAFARRLVALETLAMKLLLVEAARVPPASSRQFSAKMAGAHRTACEPAIRPVDPTRPETWPVRFQLRIPAEPVATVNANTGPRIRDLGPARTVAEIMAERARLAVHAHMTALRAARAAPDDAREHARAEKLARRFEALRRTLANPLPRARRLKRKLIALKSRAYAAAMRIVMRKPPPRQLNPLVFARADFESGCVVPAAIAPPDSS